MDYYSYYYSANYDAGLGAGYYISIGIVGILSIIAWWRIFAKAGEKGWKAIIPFYNMYVMYKLFWKVAIFIVMLVLSTLAVIGYIIVIYGIVAAFYSGSSGMFMAGVLLLVACAIVALVLQIIFYNKLAKAFGHGAGFTVGLIFLNVIFLLILAFGSSRYLGGGTERLSGYDSAANYRYREPMDR